MRLETSDKNNRLNSLFFLLPTVFLVSFICMPVQAHEDNVIEGKIDSVPIKKIITIKKPNNESVIVTLSKDENGNPIMTASCPATGMTEWDWKPGNNCAKSWPGSLCVGRHLRWGDID